MTQFESGGEMANGYLAIPPSGIGPGVLLLQEWWGLTEHITSVADRLAAAGFVVLAPDLYRGESASHPDDAKRLLMAMDMQQAASMLRAGAAYLLAHAAVAPKRVAAVGFCLGGQLALYAATAHPDVIDAVVDFYGIFSPRIPVDLSALRAPVLAHFGTRDGSISVQQVEGLLAGITASGATCEVHWYDAGHAFFNDGRPTAYDDRAAALAWERTIEFLTRTVGARG